MLSILKASEASNAGSMLSSPVAAGQMLRETDAWLELSLPPILNRPEWYRPLKLALSTAMACMCSETKSWLYLVKSGNLTEIYCEAGGS